MTSAQVNRPVNVRDRGADINQKLQLYGIATAFQNGKVPSNEQIDISLNSFIASRALSDPSTRLSAEGRGLVSDFRGVVEQAKQLLLTKNEGNLLQDFVWHASRIEGGAATRPAVPVGGDTAKQHGNEALDGLRTLGTLLITNGQFRKLLSDATILMRDIAGDAAAKAATEVKPSDDELAQIDAPAEHNTWQGVPDDSVSKLKGKMKSGKSTAEQAAGDASAAARQNDSRDPRNTALAGEDQQRDSAVDIGDGAQTGAATLWQRVPEDKKERIHANKERTQRYMSSKMPPERREQTIWRLRKMVVEIQGHPDYRSAIDTLLYLVETYSGYADKLGQQSKGAAQGAQTDPSLQFAKEDLQLLLERFANNTSSVDLIESINTIYRDADRDPKLKSWFRNVNTYIRKCLQQQGYIMEDRATEEWNQLYDSGNFLLRERYRNHTDRIVDEVKFLAEQFDKDSMNQHFRQSLQKLFNDLGKDQYGKATFKPHLVKDLTEIIIPGALRSLHYIPIPRIEYSDPMIDAVIENLVIESDNLMPNIIEIANDNYYRFGRKAIANKNANSISVHVSGIQMDLRDVSYYVNKKQGMPKLTDLGVMDIFLGGSGFSFKMKLSNAQKKDQQNFFKVDHVDVDVRNFNIKLRKSRHKVLFRLVKPIVMKTLRPVLQKVLEQQIKDQFNRLDTLAYQIKQEADRAKGQVQEDPENAPGIYERYMNAAQKHVMQGKKKTERQATGDKKVNIAMTKHDSIFPNLDLPGGISTKATEYKELGMRGDRWESPVFKLGSAPASANVARAPQVVRKRHAVTQSGLKGPGGDEEGISSKAAATDRQYSSTLGAGPTTHTQTAPTTQSQTVPTINTQTGPTQSLGDVIAAAARERTTPSGTVLGDRNPVYHGDV